MRIGVLYTTAVFCLGLLYISESCNVAIIVSDQPSNVTSPGYPTRVYPNNLNCFWKVVAANSDNNVVVEVIDSVIETSTNCTYDRLTFYDGLNSSAPRIATICGTQKGAYISTGSSIFIQFKTDSSQGYKGFFLKIYQTPRCGGKLTATPDRTALVSPGFPDQYFNNMRCTWEITAENENETVVLNVVDSQIEDVETCTYDSVTVHNGNATVRDADALLGKYCGSATPFFQSSKDKLTIVFVTDGSVVKAGFKMVYNSVEAGNCNMTMTIDEHQLYFVSPGYPDGYYSDVECVWTIVSTSLQGVLFSVVNSDIDDSEHCANGSVTVYSGTTDGNELGSFCGNSTPSYISDLMYMTVVFKATEDGVSKGFRAMYDSIPLIITTTRDPRCGSTSLSATTSSQYLQSPGYPIAYRNNDECLWTIAAADTFMMVKIIVLDSQLEEEPNCQYDWVKAFDGGSISSPLIQIWCGSMTPTVQSSGNKMTLQFKTDSSNVFKGFRLQYFETSTPYTCGGSLSADSTGSILTSPGYPANYKNNMDCIWTIHTTYDNIKINVLDSDIEVSSTCQYDYVQVSDGSSQFSPSLGKFCGTNTPTYESSSNYVTITFHSDNSNTDKGFKLRYTGGTFSPCTEQDLIAYVTTDYITSPNYPFNYPNDADCTWRIDTDDSDFVVSIDVITSSIEYSSGCSFDYVEAFDGFDDTSTSLGRWCGSDVPNKHSSGQYMFIKFKTDSSNTDTGFKISYTAKLQDSYLYPINVAAVVGGAVGGFFFIAFVCIVIAAVNRKSSRPTVTQVQDRRSPGMPGNIYTVSQGPYETTVAPAGFQPPPPYCQVVTGEQSRIIGQGVSPPPYPQTGATRETAPIVNQQQNS